MSLFERSKNNHYLKRPTCKALLFTLTFNFLKFPEYVADLSPAPSPESHTEIKMNLQAK